MGDTIFSEMHRLIKQSMNLLKTLQNNKEETNHVGRELALVRTKLEEAMLWLYQAENEQRMNTYDTI